MKDSIASTPGPWFAESAHVVDTEGPRSVTRVWAGDGMACVADVHPGVEPDPSGYANAALLSAAPEMLAACEAIIAAEGEFDFAESWKRFHAAVALARAAITKAKSPVRTE